MDFHQLSFEGPDAYARSGGLASRVTGLGHQLAALGHETHLWSLAISSCRATSAWARCICTAGVNGSARTTRAFVRRVVFVATPHRGSDMAGFVAMRLHRVLTWALTLPPGILQAAGDVLTANEDPLLRRTIGQGLPRSVDNMSPGNRAIRTLSALPVAPGVTAHSIIAVRGDGPPEDGSDGVVSYRSAHLDEAVSERVVRSGHSVQSHPDAIEEIRRILLEHLGGG